MTTHGETVRSIAAGEATSPVAASWRRSLILHKLDPDNCRAPEGDPQALRDGLERDRSLVTAAGPYLDILNRELGGGDHSGACIANRDGTMLALRHAGSQDAWSRRPTRMLGIDVSERGLGTNGSGTCLAEERPTAIRSDEHFLTTLTVTSCYAAPIFAPDGRLAGCLNAKIGANEPIDQRLENFIRLTVSAFGRRIETEMFAAAFPTMRLVLASARGQQPCALLAVDRDDVVVGATRRARQLLDLDDDAIDGGLGVEQLMGQPCPDNLVEAERKLFARTLARRHGNISAAAREIGVSRSTFYRKLAALEINASRKRSGG